LPTGQRKGVDGFGIVEEVELEVVGTPAGCGSGDQALTDPADPSLRLRIGVEATELLNHFGGSLESESYFLLRCDTGDVLFFLGNGVEGTLSEIP